jgi:hypothetical protein
VTVTPSEQRAAGRSAVVAGSLLLAVVGAGGAAPPDVFALVLSLPVLAVLAVPASRHASAAGSRPFLVYLGLAAVLGLASASVATALSLGGFVPVVGFLVGVYAAASATRKWAVGQRTTVP